MQAYEFNTVVHDGVIHVPEQCFAEQLSRVRVILLADQIKKVSEPRRNRFSAMRLKTKGFIFNREEAHER